MNDKQNVEDGNSSGERLRNKFQIWTQKLDISKKEVNLLDQEVTIPQCCGSGAFLSPGSGIRDG
jgi:hypothetical protein